VNDSLPAPAPVRFERNIPARLRPWVSGVLRVGVIVSSVALLIGVALGAVRGTLGDFSSPPVTLGSIGPGLVQGDPAAYIVLGLLILVVTPIVRVGVSVALFAQAKDRAFTLITLAVLVILLASVFVGVRL
jgi:uncharacterized membrane protein